jgi:hypothetical protein
LIEEITQVKVKSKALKIEDVELLSGLCECSYCRRKRNFEITKYFYEVEFNKPGGMIMPILVEITYEDDTVL